jgi:hypothetical protein
MRLLTVLSDVDLPATGRLVLAGDLSECYQSTRLPEYAASSSSRHRSFSRKQMP